MGRGPSPSSESGGFSGWLLIPLALTLAALLLPLASVLSPSGQIPDSVPFSMHSVLKADYSAEALQGLYPAININIIREAILDQDDQADEDRLEEIVDSLLTPVPSVTPRFPATATSTELPQVQPSAVPTQSTHPQSTAVLPRDPDPTEASIPSAQPTVTGRPAVRPTATPPSQGSPKPRPKPNPDPKPNPTNPPAAPTDPPRPPQPPNPYPQPDPGGPTPNPYP
jgi:hypothetical protein